MAKLSEIDYFQAFSEWLLSMAFSKSLMPFSNISKLNLLTTYLKYAKFQELSQDKGIII